MLADLDHFKRIHDTRGRLGGDELLREDTRRLRAAVGPYDHVRRDGGEGFLTVPPGRNQASSMKLAERIRERIVAKPVCYQEQSIALNASFGVAVFTPPQPQGLHSLLQAAAAIDRAKGGGRTRPKKPASRA